MIDTIEPPVDPEKDTQEFPVIQESSETGEVEPREVQVLIFDPNPPEDGIDRLVKDVSETTGRTAKIVKTKAELVEFLNGLYVDGVINSKLNLLVINSGSVTGGKQATEMDTQELFRPWLEMATNIVRDGKVVDSRGNEGQVPWGIKLMFIAPRDRDRVEKVVKKGVKDSESWIVNEIKALGIPFSVDELLSEFGKTNVYTMQLSQVDTERPTERITREEPPVNKEEDTI